MSQFYITFRNADSTDELENNEPRVIETALWPAVPMFGDKINFGTLGPMYVVEREWKREAVESKSRPQSTHVHVVMSRSHPHRIITLPDSRNELVSGPPKPRHMSPVAKVELCRRAGGGEHQYAWDCNRRKCHPSKCTPDERPTGRYSLCTKPTNGGRCSRRLRHADECWEGERPDQPYRAIE